MFTVTKSFLEKQSLTIGNTAVTFSQVSQKVAKGDESSVEDHNYKEEDCWLTVNGVDKEEIADIVLLYLENPKKNGAPAKSYSFNAADGTMRVQFEDPKGG